MEKENTQNRIFITRLKKKMKQRSLKSSDLACLSSIRQITLTNYMMGRQCPDVSELGRLAQILGVTMGWLWGLEDTPASNTLEVAELNAKLDMAVDTLRGALGALEKKSVSKIRMQYAISD